MRTFLAFDLPSSFQRELNDLITDLKAQYNKSIKWVQPENLHFTIQFLGEIKPHHLHEITEFLNQEIKDKKLILMKNPKLDLIPHKNPRIIWIEMEPQQQWVYQLAKRLRIFLYELGYKIDKKKIKFHITLARVKGKLPDYFIEFVLQREVKRISLQLKKITLYQSILKPEGPIYNAISKFELEEEHEK